MADDFRYTNPGTGMTFRSREIVSVQRPVFAPEGGTPTDRSGDTLAAAPKQVMAANAVRVYLFFQNVHDTAIMWLRFTGTASAASGSRKMFPGDAVTFEGTYVPTGAVSVFCASVAAYTAEEA